MAENIELDEAFAYAAQHAASGWLELPFAEMLAVRSMIVGHLRGGFSLPYAQLASRLLGAFVTLNFDWHLVAQTELAECRM